MPASHAHRAPSTRDGQGGPPIGRSARPIDRARTHARVDALRPLALNLLTGAATLLILALLALPAKSVLDGGDAGPTTPPAKAPRPAPDPRRVFGAYVDPWHVDDWARDVGAAPQAVAKFEAFS